MDYRYVAYTEDRRIVKGKVSATNDESAINMLRYSGYQVISLKPLTSLLNMEKLRERFTTVNPKEVILFSRQLALLLESGTDIVSSLELLQSQVANNTFRDVITDIISDLRGGVSLSIAMSKHPKVFPEIYYRSVAAGEQGGNLEIVLRQMADHIERRITTEKKVKGALTYPIVLLIIAAVVVGILVIFVLPAFTDLYRDFGADLPLTARIFISLSDWLTDYGLYVLLAIVILIGLGYAYIKTPAGRYRWHGWLLTMPVVGRIFLLTELGRCCRTVSFLYKVGLPLPDIMKLAVQGSSNVVMSEALGKVQEELTQGEGLYKPMSKNRLFLPLMVQMVGVGEETGNLDNSLSTVAQSYEVEAEDRTGAAVGLIQPILIIGIAAVVGLIAITLLTTMYSIYEQI